MDLKCFPMSSHIFLALHQATHEFSWLKYSAHGPVISQREMNSDVFEIHPHEFSHIPFTSPGLP